MISVKFAPKIAFLRFMYCHPKERIQNAIFFGVPKLWLTDWELKSLKELGQSVLDFAPVSILLSMQVINPPHGFHIPDQ